MRAYIESQEIRRMDELERKLLALMTKVENLSKVQKNNLKLARADGLYLDIEDLD